MKSVNLTETRIEPLDLTDEPIQIAPRLKDGFYHSSVHMNTLIKIEGNSFHFNMIYDYPTLVPVGTAKIAYGNFGPVSKEIKAGSGQDDYNFQCYFGESPEEKYWGTYGVVMPNGDKFWAHLDGELHCLEFKTDEELRNVNAEKEHIDDLSCPYKIQPENQGKVLWISGKISEKKRYTIQTKIML